MRSLVVSDLHLGIASRSDVLRHAGVRQRLLDAIARADRVVLLGDVLELRGTPVARVLERAGPILADIGEAAGDAQVVLVPGNHDHRPAADWIERRRQRGASTPLGTVESWRPGRSGLAARLARALGAREVAMAYPGLHLRQDVWATHGHYLDCHNTVPAIEVLAIAGVGRLTGIPTTGPRSPDAYEAMLAPVYAFNYEVAQGLGSGRRLRAPAGSAALWRRLRPTDGRPTAQSVLLGGVLLPGALAAINRAGLGPFSGDLSRGAVRRAALRAMGIVAERLEVDAEHVIFGHTHRAGPLATDADEDGWAAPGGRRLWNAGNWVYEPAVAGPPGRRSGHWPGACVVVDDEGPPRLERLLDEDVMAEVVASAERGAA